MNGWHERNINLSNESVQKIEFVQTSLLDVARTPKQDVMEVKVENFNAKSRTDN